MDACNAVEEEVDKILLKFTGIKEHADRVLSDVTNHIEALKREIDSCKLLDFRVVFQEVKPDLSLVFSVCNFVF